MGDLAKSTQISFNEIDDFNFEEFASLVSDDDDDSGDGGADYDDVVGDDDDDINEDVDNEIQFNLKRQNT